VTGPEDGPYDASRKRTAGYFPCERCGRVYRWKWNLRSHQRDECGQQPSFQCPYCDRRTKRLRDLTRHIRCRHKIMSWKVRIVVTKPRISLCASSLSCFQLSINARWFDLTVVFVLSLLFCSDISSHCSEGELCMKTLCSWNVRRSMVTNT